MSQAGVDRDLRARSKQRVSFSIPSNLISPEQLQKNTVDRLKEEFKSNFEYSTSGQWVAGKTQRLSCRCSYDRPVWNDRAVYKGIIIPHNNYLLHFEFSGSVLHEGEWQRVIDPFMSEILAHFV